MRIHHFVALATAACSLEACKSYEPQPLEPDVEWKKIQDTRLENLIASAKEQQGSTEPGVPAFDYSNGLSADEAAALAVALNPPLRAFRLERGIAEAQLLGAGVLPNPEIDTKWLVPTNASQWKGEVNALFDLTKLLLLRGVEKERARIRIEEVKWEVAWKEWEVAARAKASFVELLYWDEVLRVFEDQKKVKDRTLEGVRERQARGESSRLDVLLAETELSDLERSGRRLAGGRRRALQELNGMLGLPPDHETRLEKPEKPLAYVPVEDDRKASLDSLKDRRPDLLAAQQAYEGAEKELQLACRKQVPGVRVGPSYERDGGEDLIGFGAAMEIPIFNRNQAEIAEKEVGRERKRRLYEAELQAARAELEAAWTELDTLDAELKYYFQEVAPRFDLTLELTESAFRQGETSVLEVLQVQRRVLESKSEVLKTLRDFHRAKVEVERAKGPTIQQKKADSPDSLKQ